MTTVEQLGVHGMIEIVTAIVTFAGFVVTLMIRGNQAKVKEDLKDQITRTDQTIAVHIARNDEKFNRIDSSLNDLKSVVKETQKTVRELEINTNSMKDELVTATRKFSFVEGKLKGSTRPK